MRRQTSAAAVLVMLLAVPMNRDGPVAWAAGETPDVRELFTRGVKRWETVKTLRATFTRRERLEGRVELGPQEIILLRERRKPFSVHMHWVGGHGKNREVCYVDGLNGGKFKCTPGGVLRRLVLEMAVDDPVVYLFSRHTVLEAGLGPLIATVYGQLKPVDAGLESEYIGEVTWSGRPCYGFLLRMPKTPQSYCARVELFVDRELCFPVYVKVYDWEGQPFEEYAFKDIQLDVEYTDGDFDIPVDKIGE